jgi:hypothetical protein
LTFTATPAGNADWDHTHAGTISKEKKNNVLIGSLCENLVIDSGFSGFEESAQMRANDHALGLTI